MIKQYVIEGKCQPKGRPRFTRSGHVYTDKKTRDYENRVKASLIAQGAKPTDKPVHLTIKIYRGYLKSWSKRTREKAKQGGVYPTTRPDLDNYEKAIMDACNGILYEDDSQVVIKHSAKLYGEKEQVIIEIEELKEHEK